MRLRSGNIVGEGSASCGHLNCKLWNANTLGCCKCQDKRPVMPRHIAHNNSYMIDITYVGRSYYYCPACKNLSKNSK